MVSDKKPDLVTMSPAYSATRTAKKTMIAMKVKILLLMIQQLNPHDEVKSTKTTTL